MREPLIIGHRGASAVAPENTIAAFQAAIEAGADGIEFDVRLSRDDVPVIIHDDTLRRTTCLRSRVADLTAEELRKVDVPSLRELFELMVHNDLILYLEIKSSGLPELCCGLINEFSFGSRVIVECFDLAVLEEVKKIDSRIRTAALFQPRISTDQHVVDRALAIGAAEVALHHRLANAKLVEKAKLAGLKVVVWTVDNPVWITRARSMGIDALITNDPATMIEAANQIRVH